MSSCRKTHDPYTFEEAFDLASKVFHAHEPAESYIQGGPKTIPKLTKMIDTNDIFGTNYDA